MSLKPKINAAIDSDINTSIESSAATTVNKAVNSSIALKTIDLSESAEITPIITSYDSKIISDDITMYNNLVINDIYASKEWVLSQNYVTKDEISFDIPDNLVELINNKADKNHNHNDIYYSKTILDSRFNNINAALENKADISHNHDDVYCTNEEHSADINQVNNALESLNNELDTKTAELQAYIDNNFAITAAIPTKISDLLNDSNLVNSTELNNALNNITTLIPNTATVENQLTDKNFVNSSIATATAEFRGTVENIEDLNNLTANINDYAFYKHIDANGNTVFDRYKFNDKWDYEYTLNNSSFTAEQWATINSGITENSIPTKISELINDSGFTSNQGTITEIKINGVSKGTDGSINLTNMVTFASSQTATVAGVTKTTYRYNQPDGDQDTNSSNGSAYFPEGIIMGGTAFSAGLVTRGITGVTTPNAITGACDKENLYINFDGNFNDYSYKSNRQVILQAAIPGTHYGSNLYQYAAARGDAVKNYCDSTYALKSDIPTVNNASLVIQQNGIDIATFTANSDTDTTVDITMPTNYVDLTSNQTIDGTKIFTDIPKVYKNAYVNADIVLPDEYQLVEYIQSSGTEYIDTNSRVIANTRFTCTWGSVFNNGSFVAASNENKGYGQGNPSGSSPNIAGGGRLQNGVVTFWFSGSNYSTSLNASLSTSIYTDIITTSENTLNFNMRDIISGTVFINNTITNFTNYPINNMFLFRDSSGQYPFYSAKKIYDVKFETRASSSEEFIVVKHLIPCYRKSDHVCGFYDIIGNEFYTNKGTGTLIAGSDLIDGKLLYNLGFNYNTVLSELRSITGYNSSKTQVLKNVNGIFKWIDE